MTRGRALIDQARATEAELRSHKKAARIHRGKAREAARRLAAIKQECARLGITLTLIPETFPGRAAQPSRT